MNDYEKIMEKLKTMIDNKRFEHSVGVSLEAGKLAKLYNQDAEKAKLAGLAHDCAKCLSLDQMHKMLAEYKLTIDNSLTGSCALLHGPLGAEIAKRELGITDPDILNAIAVHTTGKKGMTVFEKIICLADYIEPGRKFPKVDKLRRLAYIDLDEALLMAFDSSIISIIKKGKILHFRTVEARNDLIVFLKKSRESL